MKPVIFYTLRRNVMDSLSVVAVTSEVHAGTPHHVMYGRDSNGTTNLAARYSRGRFETADKAEAMIAPIASVFLRYQDKIADLDRQLEAVIADRERAIISLLNKEGAL